jgi:hypothetical protein
MDLESAFIVYFLLVLLPFAVFAVRFNDSQFDDDIHNSIERNVIVKALIECKKSLSHRLCQYVTKFSLVICLYHCLLTIVFTSFCAMEVKHKLNIAVDLNYYTKTSIRTAEVNLPVVLI